MTKHEAPQVDITGVGCVTCLGKDLPDTWSNLVANQSGIREGLGAVESHARAKNRALALAISATEEAMRQSGWSQLNADDGLIVATTTGQILLWDQEFLKLVHNRVSIAEFRIHFLHQPLGRLSQALSAHLNHVGPTSLFTSACSAATQALGVGALWLRQRRVKRCVVVGVEVICDLTNEGFRSLQLLSRQTCTPFDRDRQGINLAEGAGALCLEMGAAHPRAHLSGFGFTTDGFHMTGPHPEGEGSFRAMRAALGIAGLAPSDIDWVHAHGTGSPANDLAEGFAIQNLFGEEGPWVSSTKWSHGHALAASGAIETALLVQALEQQTVLHTRGLKNADPRISVRHPTQDQKQNLRHILKNTLGFGGSNATLIVSAP